LIGIIRKQSNKETIIFIKQKKIKNLEKKDLNEIIQKNMALGKLLLVCLFSAALINLSYAQEVNTACL